MDAIGENEVVVATAADAHARTGEQALLTLLEGPSAIAFLAADGDMVAAAKALADMAKESKILAIKGCVLQGRTMTAE